MNERRLAAFQLSLYLGAFFILWTLRATLFIAIDESIDSLIIRGAYSNLVKFILWVLPAVAFVNLVRNESPAKYLGLSVVPTPRTWALCLGTTFLFLLAVALIDFGIGGKTFYTIGLSTLPIVLVMLQFGLSPLLEEILFRGLIMKELLTLLPIPLAMVLNSLLFVGVHLPHWLSHGGFTHALMANALGVFVFSLVACWLYAQSASIWPPTIAHIANNVLTTLLRVRDS